MTKYMLIIVVAVSIDVLGSFVALGMAGVAFSISTSFGWLALIPFVGTSTLTAINMSGLLLGEVVNTTVDIVFGGGLIVLLFITNIMKPWQLLSMRRLAFIIAKFIPFINLLPFYTALAVVSIVEKERKAGREAPVRVLAYAAERAGPIAERMQRTRGRSAGTATAMRQQPLAEREGFEPIPQERGRVEALRPMLRDIRPRAAARSSREVTAEDNPNGEYALA